MAQCDVVVVGSLNWDVNLFVKKIPNIGEEVVVSRIERSAGGKGGNIAVAAARVLGPWTVAIVGCLGRDEMGKKQITLLKKEGVETSGIRILNHTESGQAYVTIDSDGNDTILTHFGANQLIDEGQIMSSKVQTLLANARILVAAGSPKTAVHRVLSEARRLKKTTVWHPGVLARLGMKEWLPDIKEVPYLIVNDHEARVLSGTDSLEGSLEKFQRESPETRIIVTLGSHGVAYHHKRKHLKIGEVELKRLGKKVVNTAGCGDAFVGVYAAYKSTGVDDEQAVRLANMAGALKASRAEIRGSPNKSELEESYTRYYGSGQNLGNH